MENTPTEISRLERNLGQIVVSMGAHASLHAKTRSTSDYSEHQDEALFKGIEALRESLADAITAPDFGMHPLPDGQSWIKGLSDLDWTLALWWTRNATHPWVRNRSEKTHAEELILAPKESSNHIASEAQLEVVKLSLARGVPLTQTQTDSWDRPLSNECTDQAQRGVVFLWKLAEIAGEMGSDFPMKRTMPLLQAYVAADGPMAFMLPGRLPSLVDANKKLRPHDALVAGFPLQRRPVGNNENQWWEAGLKYFNRLSRQKLIDMAIEQCLDVNDAQKTHTYQTAMEIHERHIREPAEAITKMAEYLTSAPGGLSATTIDGDLVWQRVIGKFNTASYLFSDPGLMKKLDPAATTATASLLSCCVKFGAVANMQQDTLDTLILLSPMVHAAQQPPLMEPLVGCSFNRVGSDRSGSIYPLVEQYPMEFLGPTTFQESLATTALAQSSVGKWMLEIAPAILAMSGVAPELLWTAELLDATRAEHPTKKFMPVHWPRPLQPVSSQWLALAVKHTEGMPPPMQERWLIELEALKLVSNTAEPEGSESKRPRL